MAANLKPVVGYAFSVNMAIHLHTSLVMPYARSLGLTPADIGAYIGMAGIVTVVSSFMGGVLGDRWTNTRVLMWGASFVLLRLAFLLTAQGTLFLCLAAFFYGFYGMSQAPYLSLASELAGEKSRATVLGFLSMITGAAGVIAPVLGGLLAQRYGPRPVFLLSLPLVLLAMNFLRSVPANAATHTASCAPKPSLLRVLQSPEAEIARLILVFGIVNGAFNSFTSLILPLYAQDRMLAGYLALSNLNAMIALGTMTTSLLGGRLADKHGRTKTVGALYVLGLLPYFGLSLAKTMFGFCMLFLLTSLISNAASPGFFAMVLESVPMGLQTGFMGAFLAVSGGSQALFSALGGRLYSDNSDATLAVFYALVALSISLAIYLVHRTAIREKRAAAGLTAARHQD